MIRWIGGESLKEDEDPRQKGYQEVEYENQDMDDD